MTFDSQNLNIAEQLNPSLVFEANLIPNPLKINLGAMSMFDGGRETFDAKKDALLARKYYYLDGLARNAVDRFSECYESFKLTSKDPQVAQKVEKELTKICMLRGESWQVLFKRILNEEFKVGNAFLYKVRSPNKRLKSPLYTHAPGVITDLIFVDFDKVTPRVTPKGLEIWEVKVGSAPKLEPVEVKNAGYLDDTFVQNELDTEAKKYSNSLILSNGRDLVHFAYKKPVEHRWGVSFMAQAVGDIIFLRQLEQIVAIAIKKYMMPMVHHKISRVFGGPGQDQALEAQIRKVTQSHIKSSPDNIIVTGPGHELKVVGSESQAMRVSEYLTHFQNRVLSATSLSKTEAGIESGAATTATAARELRYSKIASEVSDASKAFEQHILWEIAFSLGYNPFENDEHQVKLIPVESDEERKTTRRSHWVDIFTKGGITLEELREKIDMPKEVDLKGLYPNLFPGATPPVTENSKPKEPSSK